jgi:hypothetical protein
LQMMKSRYWEQIFYTLPSRFIPVVTVADINSRLRRAILVAQRNRHETVLLKKTRIVTKWGIQSQVRS